MSSSAFCVIAEYLVYFEPIRSRVKLESEMRYFVASDDASSASRINAILVELRQECPAGRMVGLDLIVAALQASVTDLSKPLAARTAKEASKPLAAAANDDDIVLIVFAPDPERAMAVLRDVRRRTSARVLAVGQATDAKMVLRAIREGAIEYLDLGDLRTELSQALERLEAKETPGKLIGVLAPSGGSGASTLAVNLATVLAQKHKSCALIDLKMESGDLAPLLDLKPTHTIADLCQNFERLDFSLLQGCFVSCESGVRLLAAPLRLSDADQITVTAIESVLPLICRHSPVVVVDVDHSLKPVQKRIMTMADAIVLVLRMDFNSLRNARRTLNLLQEIGVSPDRVRIVANRCGQSEHLTQVQAEESLGVKVSLSIPDDAKSVNRANNNGIPVVLQSPTSKVARCIVELATSLAAQLNVSR